MKKLSSRSIAPRRIAAATLSMLTAFILLFCTACLPSGQSGPTTTPDPNVTSEELQPIVIQKASMLSVNMLSPIAYVYYATNNTTPTVLMADDMELTVTAYRIDGENETELDPSAYSYEVDDQGYIRVSCSELNSEIRITAKAKNTGYTAEAAVPVSRRTLTVWDIIMLGIGLYALAMGIIGKGRLYEEQYVKEGLENRYHAAVRISCLIVALLMVGAGIIAAIDAYGKYSLIKNIMYGVAVAAIVIAYFVTGAMTDKKAKKEAQEKAASGHDLRAPDAAFNFDDSEPTIDDVKR